MATSTLKTRIKHKIGTAAEWQTAATNSQFKPLEGELIVYESATTPMLKVGDGTSLVTALPFIGGNPIVSITRSGLTFTATHADGTTSTFSQQDNNTIYTAGEFLKLDGTTFSVNLINDYATNTDYMTLPVGISIAPLHTSVAVEGDPTQGALLTAYVNRNRGFQLGSSRNSELYVRGVHEQNSSTAGTGYSPWRRILTDGNYSNYALPLTGGTVTGKVYLGNGSGLQTSDGAWAGFTWYDNDKRIRGSVMISNTNRIHFNSQETGATYADRYLLPATTAGLTEDKWYDILTTKSTVTIAQGGTGATTASGACANIGALPLSGGQMTGNIYMERHGIYWREGTYGDKFAIIPSFNGVGDANLFKIMGSVGDINTDPALYDLVTISGQSGNVTVKGNIVSNGIVEVRSTQAAGYLSLCSDAEGGTIRLFSKNNTYCYEFDAYNDETLRIHTANLNPNGGYRTLSWNGRTGALSADLVYGAVWNDYAEYRSQNETIEPGYITYCDDDGKLKKTVKRLQKYEGVVSDTFGFAIGETDNCKTPLAVSGRALVYCDPEEEHFHSGDCVCAGPDGLAYRMTREEIIEFPDRIVGVVSEIPTYETWGTGNVEVNGRIWIKVK